MSVMKIIASLAIVTVSASTIADEITRSSGGIRVRAELASDERTIGSASIETADQQQQDWSVSDQDTTTVSRILEEDDSEFRFLDCNGNGISDALDLSDGADDANGNGVLDDCEYATRARCAWVSSLKGAWARDCEGRRQSIGIAWDCVGLRGTTSKQRGDRSGP